MRQRLDSEGFGLVGRGLETRDSLGQQRLVMVKSLKKKERDGTGLAATEKLPPALEIFLQYGSDVRSVQDSRLKLGRLRGPTARGQ